MLLMHYRLHHFKRRRRARCCFPYLQVPEEEGCCWSQVCSHPYSSSIKWLYSTLTSRREMQLFLLGYIIISICEIFTIGEFPLSSSVRIVRAHSLGIYGAVLCEAMLTSI